VRFSGTPRHVVTTSAPRKTEPASLSIRIYKTLEELESLRPAWEELLSEFSGATTFSSWEWLIPWWRAYGEGRELLVLAFFDDAARLIGLAPLQISQRRVAFSLKLRVLGLWGDGSGDSDNLDFPMRAGCEEQVAAALLDFVGRERKQWDICEFNTMPPDSPVAGSLAKLLSRHGWKTDNGQISCSSISLPETWKAYLGHLSSKERGKIGYYTNRLHKKYRTCFHRCTVEEIPQRLETLFALHQKRWQLLNQPGSFKWAARRQFYYELADLLAAQDKLEFWLLELDGRIVAAQFGFGYRETVFQLQEGFDPAYSADSVGYVLRAHVIQQLILQGVRRYDFLAYDAPSKARWATQTCHYVNTRFARPLSLGGAYLRMMHVATQRKQWLRARLPESAWKILHGLNCRLRGNQSHTKLTPTPAQIPGLRTAESFSADRISTEPREVNLRRA
jgi:CelD/BcsL family acetyltransferase involved in cellulose biosynthesis